MTKIHRAPRILKVDDGEKRRYYKSDEFWFSDNHADWVSTKRIRQQRKRQHIKDWGNSDDYKISKAYFDRIKPIDNEMVSKKENG